MEKQVENFSKLFLLEFFFEQVNRIITDKNMEESEQLFKIISLSLLINKQLLNLNE